MKYIRRFQRDNDLVADGIIGKKTLTVLKQVLDIKNQEHIAMFLGQAAHESGDFKYGRENLNYSRRALLNVFGKHFTEDNAGDYARNPQKIANVVYANRMGNGDSSSNDGWNYRGRDVIQLTGKNNYTSFSETYDVDVVNNPDLLESNFYWQTGLWFFSENNLWKKCDNVTDESIKKLTKRINGGYNGLDHRTTLTYHFYDLIKLYDI